MLTGVNVHDELGPNSPYANAGMVTQAILKLRPKIVRGISPTNLGGMRWLAAQGIGYIVMPRQGPAETTTALYAPGLKIGWDAAVPVAVEGWNEPDLSKPTDAIYQDWVSFTRASQAALYQVGHDLGVPVLGPSVVFASGAAALGPVPMDKLNVHTYGYPHSAVPDVASAIKQVQSLAPGKPAWITECGGSTYRAWWGPWDMTEAQQAELTMKAWADAKALGCEAFIVYELVDQHNGPWDWLAALDREKNFGVFRSDWSPKPIVVDLAQT